MPTDPRDRGDLVGREGPPIQPSSELAPREPDVTVAGGSGGGAEGPGRSPSRRPTHRGEAQAMAQLGGRAPGALGAARGTREGEPEQAMAGMLSALASGPMTGYYVATVGSALGSLYLFLSGKRWAGIFVGLWAPTIIGLAMLYKLLHPSREARSRGRSARVGAALTTEPDR